MKPQSHATIFVLLLATLAWLCPDARAQNALDRIDFGRPSSEAAHAFDPQSTDLPLAGVGAFGQSYRRPFGADTPRAARSELSFTLKCSPSAQNYLTVKLWGNDTQQEYLFLKGTERDYGAIDSSGGPPPFPNRFHYETVPLPLAWTQGKSSVQITLYPGNADAHRPARPIYSAFSHTDPCFIPDPGDATGVRPDQPGYIQPIALTASQVVATLQKNRQNFCGPGGVYDALLAGQILPGTPGAPPEVIGLRVGNLPGDIHARFTPEQWRNDAYNNGNGLGYSKLPESLLGGLTTAYLLPPFRGADGNIVPGLDHYHDSAIIPRFVSCLDGCTFLQVGDGGFGQNYNEWQGLTSSPRGPKSQWPGRTARAPGWSISIEGPSSETLGLCLARLLDAPTAQPLLKTALGQSYDADLNGHPLLRATAWERMLYNFIQFDTHQRPPHSPAGGTVSQNLMGVDGIYGCVIALERLQALFPNPAYAASEPDALNLAHQVLGLVPDNQLGRDPAYPNYEISAAGLGEAGGTQSGGYDGRYGQFLPWMSSRLSLLMSLDPALTDSTEAASAYATARHAEDAYAQFIAPGENARFLNGQLTDKFTLAQEDFITYRDPYNPNANGNGFTVNPQYLDSDPNGGIRDPYALRAAYLQTLYDMGPGDLHAWKDLPTYEATLRALIGVNPATLTPFPGEPGQPNSAWADVQLGDAAVYFNGERFYVNSNWREDHGKPNHLARVHDTTGTTDLAALVVMPHDAATAQPDENLSGDYAHPWFVRFGHFLLAFNRTQSPITVRLPPGTGTAVELIGHKRYPLGKSVPLAAHSAAVFALPGASSVGNGTPPLLPDGAYDLSSRFVGQRAFTAGQKFLLTNLGHDNVRLTDVFSARMLGISGGVVNEQPLDFSDAQTWHIALLENGYDTLTKQGGKVALQGKQTPGVTGWALGSRNGSMSQQWKLTRTELIPNGVYTIANVGSGLLLDAHGPSGDIAQNPASNTPSQQWKVTNYGHGIISLTDMSDGKAAQVLYGTANPGDVLATYLFDGGSNSVWLVTPTGGGGFSLTAQHSGLVAEAANSAAGTVIAHAIPTGAAQQQWRFTPVLAK